MNISHHSYLAVIPFYSLMGAPNFHNFLVDDRCSLTWGAQVENWQNFPSWSSSKLLMFPSLGLNELNPFFQFQFLPHLINFHLAAHMQLIASIDAESAPVSIGMPRGSASHWGQGEIQHLLSWDACSIPLLHYAIQCMPFACKSNWAMIASSYMMLYAQGKQYTCIPLI